MSIPSNKWEKDLQITPNADFWSQICRNFFSISTNTNMHVIQYKIIHRVHYTGERMFKMGFADSDICPHSSLNTTDTYMHATWECTPVKQFWHNITDNLSLLMDFRILLLPSLCLLGDISNVNINITSRIMSIALIIAKKTILMNWKSRHTSNITIWKNLLIEYISMEKLSAGIKKETNDID